MWYQKLRHGVAQRTPAQVREWVAAGRLARQRQRNATRSAGEVFADVYARRLWGGGADVYDSGSGSHGAAAAAYTDLIRGLVRDHGVRSVVDLGCGDFRVASGFVDAVADYHGVDVVADLIAHNTREYGRPGVRFSQLDASVDEPPPAELCLIRQVLQHLSNHQIATILDLCRRYPLVVVTEHLPDPAFATEPNRDKPHGPDTRLDSGSYVDIAAPPFAREPVTELLRVPVPAVLYHPGEVLRSQLWQPE
jgi:hypothetical protein